MVVPNSVVKTVKVGKNPQGVAVNPKTNIVYVVNYNDNTMSVIDGKTDNTVTSIIKVGTNPSSVAVNPNTNTLYVGIQASNDLYVIHNVQ